MATKGILYEGVPLLNGSGVPVVYDDVANPSGPPSECCCEGGCCCPILETNPPTQELLLTVDAPGCPLIDGSTCTLTLDEAGADCVSYVVETADCFMGNCPAPIRMTFTLTCNRGDGCNGFRLAGGPNSSSCSSDSSFTGKAPSFCECDPFLLEFSGLKLVNGMSTGCDCCSDFSVVISLPP